MSGCCPLGGGRGHRQDPLVDVDRVLREYAWERLADLSWWQRLCRDKLYRLEVNWSYLNVSHKLIRFTRRVPEKEDSGERQREEIRKLRDKTLSRDLCLFRTEFVNNSRTDQTFTFKTERQTKSSAHVTVQKGWKVGADLKLRLSVPVAPRSDDVMGGVVADGIDPIGITGGLSGQLEVKNTRGETYEETLTWSVDSQVSVEPKTRTVASLILREEECFADFVVESTIRATHGAIPVHQYSRKDGSLVEILELESDLFAELFAHRPGFHRDEVEGPHVIKVMTRGMFEAVYGAEQFIEIQSYPITARRPSLSPHRFLEVIRSVTGGLQHVTCRRDDRSRPGAAEEEEERAEGARAAMVAAGQSALDERPVLAASPAQSEEIQLIATDEDHFATVDDDFIDDFQIDEI